MIAAEDPNGVGGLSIGAVSTAVGIPVETLRTWERRYGFPDPERNQSGHRVYSPEVVDKLRLIQQALDDGHRPSGVVGKSPETLRELLGIPSIRSARSGSDAESSEPWRVQDPDNQLIQPWLKATADFDGEALETALQNDWHSLGALAFLNDRMRPFLDELGMAWVEHRMEVAHEHFASERLRDFLTAHWRPMSDRSKGPRVVCATLPGETHYLGLQMAATVLALAGCRVVYLGSDTPIEDIVAAAHSYDTTGVVISISVAANRFLITRDLTQLRDKLESDVQLLVGGRGAPEGLPNVDTIGGLRGLHAWGQAAT